VCLVEQGWVKDGKKTIQTLIDEAIARLGEKIEVGRFARFRVGQA
jgi:elongation factor Ts